MTPEEAKKLRTELTEAKADNERLKDSLSKFQTSEFNPDWSLLQASQESLREHMGLLKAVTEERDKLLAEREELEPVGFYNPDEAFSEDDFGRICRRENKREGQTVPLYAHPPVPTVPEGWQLVPKEPTLDMCEAAHNAEHCGNSEPHFRNAYKAMLAAAPKEKS